MRITRILFVVSLTFVAMTLLSGCKEPPPKVVEGEVQKDPDVVETERVKAEAGVGKQGQIIGDKEGIFRTPVKGYFKAKQQIVFLSVEHALNLYEGAEGHKPKTHEEFMSKIIEFNRIQLPELPEGHTYVWDPEAGELLVERPKS